MYTAAVLRPESVQCLVDRFRHKLNLESQGYVLATASGEPLPHHMTINLGPLDDSLNNPRILGQPAEIVIDSLFWSHKHNICAAHVIEASSCGEAIQTINSHPHVTICLRPPAKPFHSNKMLADPNSQYEVFSSPLLLYADIQEVP